MGTFRDTVGIFKDIFGIASPSKGLIKDDLVPETAEETVTEETPNVEEEWVWIEGYKGTDKNMQCYDNFQYELGKRYDMPDEATVKTCRSGFHMCKTLRDVFDYVKVGADNRFFQVKALVRKEDLDRYRGRNGFDSYWINIPGTINKLAAKSIEIVRELTVDEILKSWGGDEWDEKYKQLAISVSVEYAIKMIQIDELTLFGYSEPFAGWIIENNKYNIAKIVASQPDLSMDMRALFIIEG